MQHLLYLHESLSRWIGLSQPSSKSPVSSDNLSSSISSSFQGPSTTKQCPFTSARISLFSIQPTLLPLSSLKSDRTVAGSSVGHVFFGRVMHLRKQLDSLESVLAYVNSPSSCPDRIIGHVTAKHLTKLACRGLRIFCELEV